MRLELKSFKFFLFSCFLISSQVYIVHTTTVTVIEKFLKSPVVVGKSREDAEMAYFTQKFFFIQRRDVLGKPMLKFLRKYLEMQQGNEVSLSMHWYRGAQGLRSSQYKHRDIFCYNYLLDETLRKSGFHYDPDKIMMTQTELTITFYYYTRVFRNHLVLQCPVVVQKQRSRLYFIRFSKNDDPTDTSYIVLAPTKTSENAPLYVLMYTSRKIPKDQLKKPPSTILSSIQEEEEEVQNEYESPIDFRSMMKLSPESTGSQIVLFGKAAERVFITSTSFYFINLNLSEWFVDKFIQLMENMRKENEVQFLFKEDKEFKLQVCNGHIKYNPALSLRQFTPDLVRLGDGQNVQMVTRKTSFPHSQLPGFEFIVPMIACPVLFGHEQESKIVYIQLVTDANSNNWAFALLESKRNPGTVYPATFSERNRKFDPRTFNPMVEELPPIDEGYETIQSTGETSAGPST